MIFTDSLYRIDDRIFIEVEGKQFKIYLMEDNQVFIQNIYKEKEDYSDSVKFLNIGGIILNELVCGIEWVEKVGCEVGSGLRDFSGSCAVKVHSDFFSVNIVGSVFFKVVSVLVVSDSVISSFRFRRKYVFL